MPDPKLVSYHFAPVPDEHKETLIRFIQAHLGANGIVLQESSSIVKFLHQLPVPHIDADSIIGAMQQLCVMSEWYNTQVCPTINTLAKS